MRSPTNVCICDGNGNSPTIPSASHTADSVFVIAKQQLGAHMHIHSLPFDRKEIKNPFGKEKEKPPQTAIWQWQTKENEKKEKVSLVFTICLLHACKLYLVMKNCSTSPVCTILCVGISVCACFISPEQTWKRYYCASAQICTFDVKKQKNTREIEFVSLVIYLLPILSHIAGV